jgi:hypothetical protein
MKSVLVLFCGTILFCSPTLAAAQSAAATGQPRAACTGTVQNLNNLASVVATNASSYWTHRANYVSLLYGWLRLSTTNPEKVAAQEKTKADSLRAAVPNQLTSFNNSVATTRTQKCLTSAQTLATVEAAKKMMKRIRFDQFPPETDQEDSGNRGQRLMP